MGRNLTTLNIKDTYEGLVQISGSILTDGTGSVIPSIEATASFATSASSASTSVSSSYALTASFAENVVPQDTGSLLTTASISDATVTFTKGDASTFSIVVNNVVNADSASYSATAVSASYATSATSASYALTASFAENVVPQDTGSLLVTASSANDTITYTKGDGTTFTNVINNVSASISASYATTALSASYATDASTATSASYATNASTAVSSSYALTASYLDGAATASPLQDVLNAGNIASSSIVLENSLQSPTTQSNNTSSLFISAQVSESLSFPVNDNIAVFVGGTKASNDNFYTSQITSSRNVLVYGVSQPSSYAGMVNLVSVSESVVLASSWVEMGSGFGYSGETRNAAAIASSGVIYGGVPHGGLYSTYLSYIYGSSNDRSNAAVFGGRSHTINQSYNSQIFGGQSNTIPNAFVDNNQIFGGDSNTITGGSGNGLALGIQNTISAGNYNHIFGGSSNTVSANSGHCNIIGSYGSTISSTNSFPNCEIIGGNNATISGNTQNAIIVGGNGGTISGGTADTPGSLIACHNNSSVTGASGGHVFGARTGVISGGTLVSIFGGQQNTISSGYLDSIVAGRENVIESRSTGNFGNVIVGSYVSRIRGNNSGQNAILGGTLNVIGTNTGTSYSGSAIIGGRSNSILHNQSVILAGSGSVSTRDNQVVVPHLLITGSAVGKVTTLTDVAGTTTMDCSASNFFTLSMPAGGSTTLTPSNIQAGQTINVKITQNATPSTLSFASSIDFEGGSPFVVSTSAGAVDVMTFISFDGTTLQATGLKNFS